jgi:DNA (cytosine-5)-methyltransferase 1
MRTLPSGELMDKGHTMTEQEYSNHNPRTQAKFQAMINNRGVIPDEFKTKKFAQRLLPKKWGNKGPTITITSLADDYVHYAQARTPTVRECARMQTFPDWYKFAGKRTTGGIRRAGNPRENIFDREVPKYTQIGNAVPVKLGKEIGLHFTKILTQ